MNHFRKLLIIIGSAWVLLILAGCSGTPEQRYTKALEKGKKLLESSDSSRAALEFANAAQARPNEAEGHYWLAQAYLSAGRTREAIFELRRASDVNPNYTPAQVKLAELMIMTHNDQLTKDAESRLMKVLTGDPGDDDAMYALAASEAHFGNSQDAEKHLNQILERSPRNLRSAVALAQVKAAAGDFGAAEQVLKKAIESLPTSSDAVVALGTLYAWMGKPAAARDTLQRAVQLDPKNSSALATLGSLQVQTGEVPAAENTYKQIAALHSKENRLAYAIFLLQQKRSSEAVAELERLFNGDRSDRLARTALVAAYLTVNRTADAQSLLDAELKKNGKDTDALVQRSEIYLRDGKYSEATRDLEQALHNDPSAQAHYLMSKVHRESGAIMLQKQELSEALRLDPDLLRARIELANVLLLSNNPRAALEMLDAAPERQKGRMGYVLARNWALIANGDPGGRQGVEQTLGVARQPEALLQDAVLKLRARNLPGARAALEEVLKTDPEDMRALSTLVQTYMAQKQPEAALERIRRSVGLRPDSTKLQIFLGTWLLENGREAEGRQVLTAVKAAAPKNVASDLLLAGWDITTHNLDAARQRLTTLIVTNPGNIDAHMMLGNIEDMSEHHAGAVEHYRKVLELDSGNLRAMNNLAYNLAHDPATVDDALKYAQKAKELAPQSPQIQDTLGWVYYRKGLYAMAAKELEAVHAKEPTPLVKYHLGLVYMRLGRSNEGGRLVAAALVADPTLADKEDVQ